VHTVLLSELLEIYRIRRPLADSSLYQMRRTVGLFGHFLGHQPRTEDLTADTVSRWIMALEATHSPTSRHGHRGKLLILWRFAARHGFAAEPEAREIRRAPRPEPNPVAWSQEQVEQLVAVCRACLSTVLGRPLGSYLVALVRAGWDTGLRRSDLWGLRREDIGPDGSVAVRQRKTGWVVSPRLSEETRRLVLAEPGAQPLAWWASERQFYKQWGSILGRAHVGTGALQRLRRSAATAVASLDGTDATREFLGHRTADMWTRYVDRRLAWPRRYSPPGLAG
jgi:integrase